MKFIDHSNNGKANAFKPPLSASAAFVRVPLDAFGVTIEFDRKDLERMVGMLDQIQRDRGTTAIE